MKYLLKFIVGIVMILPVTGVTSETFDDVNSAYAYLQLTPDYANLTDSVALSGVVYVTVACQKSNPAFFDKVFIRLITKYKANINNDKLKTIQSALSKLRESSNLHETFLKTCDMSLHDSLMVLADVDRKTYMALSDDIKVIKAEGNPNPTKP